MKPHACLVDLDGTLCKLDEEYLALIRTDPKHWVAFECHIPFDVVNEPVHWILDKFDEYGFFIIILTARPERCRVETVKWLQKNHICYDLLVMRPEDDRGDDAMTKERALKKIQEEYKIFCAFEDRPHVVEMFVRNGIFTFDVGQGKELEQWARKRFLA